MATLVRDSIPSGSKERLIQAVTKVGNVYLTPLDESNGITPHSGDSYSNKLLHHTLRTYLGGYRYY